MEGTESTTAEGATENNENQGLNQKVLMSNKPLHRFIQKEPRNIGIVVLIFGCAELMMGFRLAEEIFPTSYGIYVPFWQGVLFTVSGILSIYTETHPSKKMVTVCLAMYIVSIFGIFVSVGYRIYCFSHLSFHAFWAYAQDNWPIYRVNQLFGVEGILFISSLCQFGLLIFLCIIARLALKSTHTQVIVQHIQRPVSDTTSN